MKLSLHRHNKHTHMELASCLIAGSVEEAFILLCGELTALIDVTVYTVLHHLKIFRTRLDVITLVYWAGHKAVSNHSEPELAVL